MRSQKFSMGTVTLPLESAITIPQSFSLSWKDDLLHCFRECNLQSSELLSFAHVFIYTCCFYDWLHCCWRVQSPVLRAFYKWLHCCWRVQPPVSRAFSVDCITLCNHHSQSLFVHCIVTGECNHQSSELC